MIKHSQSNKFAIFLQYFKKVRSGVHVQSTQNRKLVVFVEYDKKSLQLLLCSVVMQNIQIFCRDPAMFVVTYLF